MPAYIVTAGPADTAAARSACHLLTDHAIVYQYAAMEAFGLDLFETALTNRSENAPFSKSSRAEDRHGKQLRVH